MKNRSDSILIYKDIKDNRLYCRIGICNDRSISCHVVCSLLKNCICCVYGNNNETYTERFHFDNTKHKIILSTDICKLCDDCTDRINKISSCRHNIKIYIDAFVEKIDSVESR